MQRNCEIDGHLIVILTSDRLDSRQYQLFGMIGHYGTRTQEVKTL